MFHKALINENKNNNTTKDVIEKISPREFLKEDVENEELQSNDLESFEVTVDFSTQSDLLSSEFSSLNRFEVNEAVACSLKGELFASCSFKEGAIKIWNGKTLNCIQIIDVSILTSFITNLCFDSTTTIIIAASKEIIYFWSISNGNLLSELKGTSNNFSIQSLTCSSSYLITGSTDSKIKIWDINKKNKLLTTLLGHKGTITNICMSQNEKLLISGSIDRTVKVWDLKQTIEGDDDIIITSKLLFSFQGDKAVSSLTLSKDERFVFAGFYDGSITMWNLNTFQLVYHFHHKNDKKNLSNTIRPTWSFAVTYLCVDGQNLISCSLDGLLVFRKIGQATCLEQFYISDDEVPAFAICPNKFILASCYDKSLKLWKIKPMTHEKLHSALYEKIFIDTIFKFENDEEN